MDVLVGHVDNEQKDILSTNIYTSGVKGKGIKYQENQKMIVLRKVKKYIFRRGERLLSSSDQEQWNDNQKQAM